MKNLSKTLIVLIAILITVPIVSYFINQEFWLLFGEYMNVILTPLIALIGIMVTFSLNYLSQKNIEKQRMLQRPLLFLRRLDFENKIELELQNKGLGPAVVTSLTLTDFNGKVNKGIYESIQGINLTSDTFTGDMTGLVLSANENKTLFKLTDSCPNFENVKIQIRERFSDLELVVNYKDIYEEKMPEYKCNLKWYGRDL